MTNMWQFTQEDISQSPSITKDGMSVEEEMLWRIRGVCCIQTVGSRLELPLSTIATATVLFHRFYTRESFKDYCYSLVGATCLFLAGKSDEASRKVEDVARAWLNQIEEPVFEDIDQLSDEILYYELLVLDVTCCDLTIELPYHTLMQLAEYFNTPEEILVSCLTYANDSLRIPLCTTYEAKMIAAACFQMGYAYHNVSIPDSSSWNMMIDDFLEDLIDISNNIVELYRFPDEL
ncbi:cyclin-like protein [Pilobolus umbonatus]|nr:cyclin-like protein [Pilobolus umbonatus]